MIALVFDTETTGLIDNHVMKLERQPHVTEYYGCMVDLSTGEVQSVLEHLVRIPDKSLLSEKISGITGITWDMLEPQQPFSALADEIKRQIETAPMVIAHNLSFDMEMMALEYERLSQRIEFPRRRICTVEQTIHMSGFRHSLSTLHEMLFGTAFAGAHRARVDVPALVRCCVELHKRGMI